jgi:hypothetical protein
MNEVAREVGIPLIGHTPTKLGFEALLQARPSLAHVGVLAPQTIQHRQDTEK